MTTFVFVSWDGAGNQTPAIGVAAALHARGHRVLFAGYRGQRERFTRLGFGFRLLPEADRGWPVDPPEWIPALVRAVWACEEHLTDLAAIPGVAEGDPVLVIDCLMFAALAAAERLPVRTAVLVHSAPGALLPEGGGLDGLVLDALNDIRARAGLAPVAALRDTWRPFPAVCTSVAELDPVASDPPPGLDFVGPVFPPASDAVRLPWSAEDRRPLVLVSFSSGLAWDQTSRIRRTVAALADGAHRVLVTTGMTDIPDLDVGPDVVVRPFVPHTRVLPEVAVTVTHAGHGTVAASLAAGVPLVCLPNLGADQVALAATVASLPAGLVLDGEQATSAEIAAAVRTVRTDPRYAEGAGRMAEVIAAAPGVAGAVERLEGLAPVALR